MHSIRARRSEGAAAAAPSSFARDDLEDDLAGFAIADLGGVDDARARCPGETSDAIDEHEDRLREVDFEQRLGRGELEDAVRADRGG